MKKRILLTILLGICCISIQAKPTLHTKQSVLDGAYYIESDWVTMVSAVPLISSNGIELGLQAQKPTAKIGEEEIIWRLMIRFDKADKEVVIRETSDFLILTLFDKTDLKLRPAFDVAKPQDSWYNSSLNQIYYYHTVLYTITPEQLDQIINSGVENIQFSYGFDMHSSSVYSFDKSFKKDKMGKTLKGMLPIVKSALDKL